MSFRFRSFMAALLLAGLAFAASAKADSPHQQRIDIRNTAHATLARLYKAQPSSRSAIRHAVGYGAFHDFGMKILFAGGGKGRGLVVNNKTKKETFMKMLEVQAGLGVGIKKFDTVFVFETETAMNDFVDKGWEFGGEATAAAKMGDQGKAFQGAVSVAPGIWMYQITESGLAAEIAAKGTRYYKDDDLNQ